MDTVGDDNTGRDDRMAGRGWKGAKPGKRKKDYKERKRIKTRKKSVSSKGGGRGGDVNTVKVGHGR